VIYWLIKMAPTIQFSEAWRQIYFGDTYNA
jgi:hypothetical protein